MAAPEEMPCDELIVLVGEQADRIVPCDARVLPRWGRVGSNQNGTAGPTSPRHHRAYPLTAQRRRVEEVQARKPETLADTVEYRCPLPPS
jgi:hypothetical protein